VREVQHDTNRKSKGKKYFNYLSAIPSVFAVISIALSSLEISLENYLASHSQNKAIASEISNTQKRDKLIIGVKDNLPPLGFRDRDGNLSGLEIDIARELAKELDISFELRPLKNRDRLSALQNNQIDLAIAQITVTTNRSRLVDFSLPYYTDSTIAIAKRGTTSQELKQPVNISVLKNSAAIAVIQSQFPKAAIIGVNTYADGLGALQSGKVKAFVGDRSSLAQWLKEHPDYEMIGQPLAVHSLAIALPRGLQHLDLRDRVFDIVEKWRKNGWLKERASYWNL
jgi:polar amino acid transport system substrate-binding protein